MWKEITIIKTEKIQNNGAHVWRGIWITLVVLGALAALITAAYFVCRLFFKDQLAQLLKQRIISQVTVKEDMLWEALDILEDMKITEVSGCIMMDPNDSKGLINRLEKGSEPYENDVVSSLMKNFRLKAICYDTKISDVEYMEFVKTPFLGILYDGSYNCGFYYSGSDEPVDVRSGEVCALSFEIEQWPFKYWYQTEKIIDHWWFFEMETYID